MLLALSGFLMVAAFMALIMTKRLSPTVALIIIPVVTALLVGFEPGEVGEMALEGVKALAPTGVMLMFAILYFGVMIDAGLFDPVVRRIVRVVHGDPLKVIMGTAALAAFVSLDGDGSTTYMITVAAMLPLYRRLGMNALNLTCVTILAGGVMNMTPWGGPLARAASALQVDPGDIFLPMLPSMAAGLAGVFAVAYVLGRRERKRLSLTHNAPPHAAVERPGLVDDGLMEGVALLPDPETSDATRRPKLLWANAALTACLMGGLIAGLLPLSILFMLGFAAALFLNYPRMAEQRERLVSHAPNVIAVISIIFAAGVFTGVLNGTGMVRAMSSVFVSLVPDEFGPHMAPIVALASMPFTFFMSNDAFYFGVLPIVADAAGRYDITHVEMARASLVGQPVHLLSPLVPSTYLLVGLAGVELGDHQRFTLKWTIVISLLIGAVAIATAAFPFGRS